MPTSNTISDGVGLSLFISESTISKSQMPSFDHKQDSLKVEMIKHSELEPKFYHNLQHSI